MTTQDCNQKRGKNEAAKKICYNDKNPERRPLSVGLLLLDSSVLLLLVVSLVSVVRVRVGRGSGELRSEVDTSESRRVEGEGSDRDEGGEEDDDGSDSEVDTRIATSQDRRKFEAKAKKTDPAICSRDL